MAIDDRSLPDRSIDQTLLSEDVYFDVDATAHVACALGDTQDDQDEQEEEEEEEERESVQDFHNLYLAEPTLPSLPTSYDVLPYPPTIHKNHFVRGDDTVSELSVDQYSKAPPQAIELEYIDGVDLAGFYMKDTPRTIPMGYLEGMEVTAWNTEGIHSTDSKRRTCNIRHLCFILACLLLTVTAVLVPIGILQADKTESVAASTDLSSVGGNDPSNTILDSYVPSSSPTERPSVPLDTESTPAPTIEGTSVQSSSPPATPTETTANSPTNSPSLAPSQTTTTSPSSDFTLSPTNVVMDPPTSSPTPEPTDGETESPTIAPMDTPTEPPTGQQGEDTQSPTVTPAEAPTVSPTPLDTADASPSDPGGCVDAVEMSQSCYESGSTLRISYENCDPVVGDWIGVYSNPDAINPSELDEPDIWIYTCGDSNCFDLYESGQVRFSFGSPLPEGTYGAYLVREAPAPPYASIAMTTFEISTNCEG